MLCFLVALFRAWGIELSLEDCPDGAPLVSARWLEAASADDSSPAAASWPRISTWGAGDPRRPPTRMTSAPHPQGRDSPMTPLRPSAPLAPRSLPLLRPTGRTVWGSRPPRRSSERGPRRPRPPPRPPPRTRVWRAAVSPPPERAGALCRTPPSFSSSSAASFRLFIFSAWRRLIRRCSGAGGLEMPHLHPCATHTKWGQGKELHDAR